MADTTTSLSTSFSGSLTAMLNSVGASRNTELKNSLLMIQLSAAFIECLEFMQSNLLEKMNGDRVNADTLRSKLTMQQDLARSTPDATKDDKKSEYAFVVTFDSSENPPYPDMTKVPLTAANADKVQQQVDKNGKFGGFKIQGDSTFYGGDEIKVPSYVFPLVANDLREYLKQGAAFWVLPRGNTTGLSGKQVYTYYDQQAEATKASITALNSLTSQDNLTLQSLRSKIETVTQFLSSLMKNGSDNIQSVIRKLSS